MRWNRTQLVVVLFGPLTLLVTVAAMLQRTPNPPPTRLVASRAGPSCPHDFKQIIGPDTFTQVPISGQRTNVPMYHDCQRLIVAGPLRVRLAGGRIVNRPVQRPAGFDTDMGARFTFGPVVGLFVSERLASFSSDAGGGIGFRRINRVTADSILSGASGLVVVDTTASPQPGEAHGVAVIQFFNHGPGVYPPLGIGPNFTCLYLSKDPWEAWSVNIDQHPTCPSPLTRADLTLLAAAGAASGRVKELRVRPLQPSTSPADYAEVGRFDWDWVRREHYVTIKCDTTTWCEIGNGLPISSPTYAQGAPPHIWRIKGWHDEQRLTRIVSGLPVVAAFRGTLVPDDSLQLRTIHDFEAGWVRVAAAYLTHASSAYKTKLNFDLARVGDQSANVIYFRKIRNDTIWQARIISANGDTLIKRVHRRPAPEGVHVPATARWRWLSDDETIWTKCDEGCCEVIG